MTEVSANRLRWRCRRGMLELDTWLATFLDTVYPLLGDEQQQAFSRLLDREDPELYQWLAGREDPPADLQSVVAKLRTCKVRER